ncbi:MAG: TIGR01459 family HAD-type hydrolase [Alphaproteobacteria bacterium]
MVIQYKGLREIAQNYDGFILDLWGVMHDGKKLYPGVRDCLVRLRSLEKKIYFLSNAPRRKDVIAGMLEGMGIPHHLYDGIHTSGEAVIKHLEAEMTPNDQYYILAGEFGHELGQPLIKGLGLNITHNLETATHFLGVAPNLEENITPYIPLLQQGLSLNLPMICANPDRVVNSGNRLVICAGSLAEWYQQQGGQVIWFGKPYASVYQHLRSQLQPIPSENILAIGDGMETDIKGANTAHIPSCLITSGIHLQQLQGEWGKTVDNRALEALFCLHQTQPTFTLPCLQW